MKIMKISYPAALRASEQWLRENRHKFSRIQITGDLWRLVSADAADVQVSHYNVSGIEFLAVMGYEMPEKIGEYNLVDHSATVIVEIAPTVTIPATIYFARSDRWGSESLIRTGPQSVADAVRETDTHFDNEYDAWLAAGFLLDKDGCVPAPHERAFAARY